MTTNQEYPPIGPTGNGNGRTSAVIELVLTPELERKQIVTTCSYNFKSKSIHLKLNHIYQWIDSPFNLEFLKKTYEEFCSNLKNNGVTTEDITQLQDMLSLNHDRILNHYRQQELEQTSAGQRNRKERIDRVKNMPPKEVSVSQALMIREGNVRIKGMFVGGSVKVENMCMRIGFWCGNCDHLNILADYRDTRPILESEIPSSFGPKYLSRFQCEKGCEGTFAHSQYKDLVSARVELHDTKASGDPPNINVILFNNYALETEYTEQVIATGSIQQVRVKDKSLSHLFVGLDGSTGFDPVEYVDKRESVEITPDDEKKIQELGIQNKGREFDALADLVAPYHQGHEDAKKGLLLCAVNTGIDSVRRKRRINVLFLGETGLDKSGLARDGTRLVPGSKFASAADSTTNSLICVVDGETGHYRYGPLLTANGAMCVVDEIGSMPREEQRRLYSLMQEGVASFGRFGFTRPLEGSAGVIMTANPDSISGKFRYKDKIDPNEFPFLGAFRNRIDLIFIFRTNRSRDYLQTYTRNKTEIMDNYSELLKKEGENYQYLVKHILHAKKFDPQFSQEAELMINQYFENVMTEENSEASNRLWETLRNLCYAIARLKLKNTIDADDVKEVIDFYNEQLKYWSKIADIPSDIRDQAYEEIVKKIPGQPFKSEFEELLQTVCKDNIYLDKYTEKFNKKTGERDWNISTNKKIREIRDKFTKGPKGDGIRDDRILVLDISPLTLGWRETYAGSDKEVTINIDAIDDCDENDLNDLNDLAGKGNEKISDNSSDNARPEIYNKDVNPEVNQVNQVTLPSNQELTKVETAENDQNDLEHNSKEDNNPPEDYGYYVKRQAENVRVIEKEDEARRIFDELASKNTEKNPGIFQEKEVLESKFKEKLASSGFNDADIDVIIKDMEKDRLVERIYTESNGVLLRKVIN